MQEMQETWVQCLGWEDPLERKMAIHFSIFLGNSTDGGVWWATVHGVIKSRILQSDWAHTHTHTHTHTHENIFVAMKSCINGVEHIAILKFYLMTNWSLLKKKKSTKRNKLTKIEFGRIVFRRDWILQKEIGERVLGENYSWELAIDCLCFKVKE